MKALRFSPLSYAILLVCGFATALFAQSNSKVFDASPDSIDIWVDESGDTMTGDLTLDTGANLNLSLTGRIDKGGFPFIHTPTSAGYQNVGVGSFSLANLYSSGLANTAIGYAALENTTTGDRNTGLGVRALQLNANGFFNTAVGFEALMNPVTGERNTAMGFQALRNTTLGDYNTACGTQALLGNSTGSYNTASGMQALRYNDTGEGNTATGFRALFSNTSGFGNTATGYHALYNTTGYHNVAVGYRAGYYQTTGANNIAIGNRGTAGDSATIKLGVAGTQTKTYVAGIRGVTTDVADAIGVMIDSNGQLGTVSSSCRFKEDILDMGDATDRLLELRPVVFRYKADVQSGERPLEYGLIAEEVAEVFPELVVYDEEGKPFTVKYHQLSSMLLNEVKKLRERTEELEDRVMSGAFLQEELQRLQERIEELERRGVAGTQDRNP